MKLTQTYDLFEMELQDLYSAETQLVEALPELAKAAKSKELQKGFQDHLKETKEHVKRLEKVGKLLEMDVEGKVCAGMKGLLREGEEAMKLQGEDVLIDTAIITGSRKVEHYEVIGYTSLITLAKHMKEKDVADILKETLDEEEMTDKKLALLAKSEDSVNAFGKLMMEVQEAMK